MKISGITRMVGVVLILLLCVVLPVSVVQADTEMNKLTASDAAADDMFGVSVSISGDTVVVGSCWDDIGAATDAGSAYVFYRNQGGPDAWGQVSKLTASDAAADDQFGISVSISGDTIVVGSCWDDIGAATNAGSAYVFIPPTIPVGGDIFPINKLGLIAPWITLTLITVAGCILLVRRRVIDTK